MTSDPLCHLRAFDSEKEEWQVMIETPKGCHNKYKYDEQRSVFILNGVLPEGMVFPYDFGFLPETEGEDGDPVDVLLLMDEPAFCGCLVPARLIGVIEAEQTEKDGEGGRNDRLVAIPIKARNYSDVKSVKDLDEHLINEIEQFFVSYNRIHGKKFKVLGCHGPGKAEELAQEAIRRHQKGQRRKNGARRNGSAKSKAASR